MSHQYPILTQEQVDEGKRAHKRRVYRYAGRLLARHGADSAEYREAHTRAGRLRLAPDWLDLPVIRWCGHDYRAHFALDTDAGAGELLYSMIPCSTCALCLDAAGGAP